MKIVVIVMVVAVWIRMVREFVPLSPKPVHWQVDHFVNRPDHACMFAQREILENVGKDHSESRWINRLIHHVSVVASVAADDL